jgi:hypothetical protein
VVFSFSEITASFCKIDLFVYTLLVMYAGLTSSGGKSLHILPYAPTVRGSFKHFLLESLTCPRFVYQS